MAIKVAVVGAGPFGLMALKNLKEDGFDVTGYDARVYVGGLWNYSEDEYLSVQESTIFNSSKHRTAVTDFPFSEDFDDYPTWQQMYKYLDDYCDHFDLEPHIKLSTKAVGLRREGGIWGLEVLPTGGEPRTDWYNKIVVSVGSFVQPKKPHFEGIELLDGTAAHARECKGQECSHNWLARYSASKAYLSHRNGLILFPRYTADYATFDQAQILNFFFFQAFLMAWCPNLFNWVIGKAIISMSKKAFPKIPEK